MGIDKKKIALLIRDTEKKFGKGSIYTLGSKYEMARIPRTPTGLRDFDSMIGGGIPQGRVGELYGPESAGKTSLAYRIMSMYSLALMIDMEGTFDAARAKLFGNRKGQLLIRRPDWGEQAIDMIMDFAAAGMPLIVIDSVPAMIPKREYEAKTSEKSAGMAMVAGLLSRKLPKICSLCEKSGTTVLFINQVRANMKAMTFGDPHSTPGGFALKHFCSLRMKIMRKQWLRNGDDNLGQISKLRVVKSKVSTPYLECELALLFDMGFLDVDSYKTPMKQIAAARKKAGKQRPLPEEEQIASSYDDEDEEEELEEEDDD